MVEVLKGYDVLVLRRHDLVGDNRRLPLLQFFDEICALGGTGDELTFELSPLAVLWLARDAPNVLTWLRDRGFCTVDLRRADLRRADLTGADLSEAILSGASLTGADLRRADLRWADLTGASLTGAIRAADDPPIAGWTLRNGRLQRST